MDSQYFLLIGFKDLYLTENSFARGIIKAEINDKLEKSNKLIVLCSTIIAAGIDLSGYKEKDIWHNVRKVVFFSSIC